MTYFEQQLAEAKDDAEKMQICLEAVKNWYNLKYVPEKFKTVEMCNIAVKDNGYALIYVPEEFKTLDMCIEIVKQETWAFMVVPENLKEQVTTATGVQQGGTAMLHHEYESALEKAVKEIFKEEVEQICHRLITYAEIARRKGILALEGKLDQEKIAKRDLLETGLMLAVDGTERAEIKNYLDSWIEANCNNSVAYYDKILASVIKTGVLCIQEGYNPRIAEYKMTVLIPRELTPDSLMPSNEKYFRRRKMTDLELEHCLEELRKGYSEVVGFEVEEFFESMPEHLKTVEFYLEVVKRIPYYFAAVPEEFKTAEMCLEAVKNWYNLKYVPEKFKTAELCNVAVRKDGLALQYVPENLKTAELCLEAVKNSGYALEYVPENLKTAEMCLEAIEQDYRALRYVPETLRTAELCDLAVSYAPEELQTTELCLEAVKNDSSELQVTLYDVPENLKTAEMCDIAVKKKGSLGNVPEKFKTAEMCLEAVRQNGLMLEYVPENLKTAQLCNVAVKANMNGGYIALEYVPEALKTYELCNEAFGDNCTVQLNVVPEKFKTAEFCLKAVKYDGRALVDVPENLKTLELCIEAVKQDKRAIKFVPRAMKEEVKKVVGLGGGK